MKKAKEKKVAVGVSSSVSIYKACEVVRGFQKQGLRVQVVMTKNAARLISPLLFSALSGEKALVDPFEEEYSERIAHVDLAREISLLCVAPATANIIGKFAAGVADDFLSTLFLAARCPVLIAPAMNEAMYFSRQTQDNIRRVKTFGVKFVEPGRGYLACKEEGWGRLAATEKIVEEGMRLIEQSQSLKGKTVLVTAGPTREHLDPVRFLTNRSSGKMGFALAEEALSRGAKVILISGPTSLIPARGAEFVQVQSAGEMEKEVGHFFKKMDVLVMAAAVSDFRFAEPWPQKIKKKEFSGEVKLIPTPDILARLGQRKKDKILVGFAAETGDVARQAQEKMAQKNLDLIVANDVSNPEIGFESDLNRVTIFFRDGQSFETEKISKREISRVILDKIEDLLGQKS